MTDNGGVETITLAGRRYVILPETDYLRLTGEPPLPEPDEHGHYPAASTARAILARKIMRRRRAAGLTQAELAGLAGVRSGTLGRIERAERTASAAAVEKIDAALRRAETGRRSRDGR